MGAEHAIRAESLSKRFRSGGAEVVVFENLTLQVCRGERVAVVGESGAGKSTLLHLLGGLDRPTGGEIFYDGRNIVGLSDRALAEFRNQEVGFVWQSPSLLMEFTAEENVMMPLLIRGQEALQASRLAAARLEEVGLTARRRHLAGELSGGEQQRVALARALVSGPKVLLADEPTGSLDHKTGEMVMNLLAELHQRHRLTSIFVTHNLQFASRCDRVLEFEKGSLRTPLGDVWQATGVVQDATRLGGGTYV